MTASIPAFSDVLGQPEVVSFLSRSIQSNQVTHAYLFLGRPGSGKTDCALAFAKALLCDNNGCNACDSCIRIQRNTHPDVVLLEPGGVAGYMVEQIRQLVHDVQLSPVRAKEKVFIVQRADLLQGAAANALLKTLEEPPAKVSFILIGRNREAMLPTILSRCQVVPFKTIPTKLACRLLAEQTGYSAQECRYALAAGGNSLTQARSFLFSNSERSLRNKVLAACQDLRLMDDADVLDVAADICQTAAAQIEDQGKNFKQQREDLGDFLGSSALKAMEKSHKRELSAFERRRFLQVLAIIESWYADCLVIANGADESLLANTDCLAGLVDTATRCDSGSIRYALEVVHRARTLLSYNVNSQLVLETLLISLKRGLVITCHTL